MEIKITCKPVFWFELSQAHIDVLRNMAIHHYDMECNKAALQGGFLYGWNVCSMFDKEQGSVNGTLMQATFRDLDLCLKIMEAPALAMKNSDVELVKEMQKSFHGALAHSNKVVSKLEFTQP